MPVPKKLLLIVAVSVLLVIIVGIRLTSNFNPAKIPDNKILGVNENVSATPSASIEAMPSEIPKPSTTGKPINQVPNSTKPYPSPTPQISKVPVKIDDGLTYKGTYYCYQNKVSGINSLQAIYDEKNKAEQECVNSSAQEIDSCVSNVCHNHDHNDPNFQNYFEACYKDCEDKASDKCTAQSKMTGDSRYELDSAISQYCSK